MTYSCLLLQLAPGWSTMGLRICGLGEGMLQSSPNVYFIAPPLIPYGRPSCPCSHTRTPHSFCTIVGYLHICGHLLSVQHMSLQTPQGGGAGRVNGPDLVAGRTDDRPQAGQPPPLAPPAPPAPRVRCNGGGWRRRWQQQRPLPRRLRRRLLRL